MKKLLFFVLPFFCLASFAAGSMNVFVNGNLTALRPSATNAVLITAKSYTDAQIQAIPAAHDYAPDIATASNVVLTAAKTYASSVASSSATTASDYALAHAKLYSQTNTLLEAKNFAGSQDALVLSQAKQYTDTAKSAAISTASSDATSKANAALANAKTYATTNTLVASKSYTDSETSSIWGDLNTLSSDFSDLRADFTTFYWNSYNFAGKLRVLTGSGGGSSNPPHDPNNKNPYPLPSGRTKVALTNLVSDVDLRLFVDVNSPESTPIGATVEAGNARYCTVSFSGFPSSGTVLFHLLVTAIECDNSRSVAVTQDFYLSYTANPE